MTSRARVLEALGLVSPLALATLPAVKSTAFLLKRTGREQAGAGEVTGASELARELDGLPLALEQAAAYVLDRDVPFAEYLASYRLQRLALLEQRGPQSGAYPQTVATTWLLNFQQVAAESAAAAELLQLSAFLGAGAIPFELLGAGRGELGPTLGAALAADESLSVYELLKPLARFSLVWVDRTERTYSVHRLVQEVTRSEIDAPSSRSGPARRQRGRFSWGRGLLDALGRLLRTTPAPSRSWAERAVRGLNAAFPYVEVKTWATCERLAPHALAASELIATYGLQSNVSARLLSQVAFYLEDRGQYAVAEPLYQQALEIRRQVLGEQHPYFATSLHNMAGLYDSTGRYEQAEPLYQQALEVVRQVLGPSHPHTKLVQANYARARRAG